MIDLPNCINYFLEQVNKHKTHGSLNTFKNPKTTIRKTPAGIINIKNRHKNKITKNPPITKTDNNAKLRISAESRQINLQGRTKISMRYLLLKPVSGNSEFPAPFPPASLPG